MKTKKTKFEKFSKKPVLNKDLMNKVNGGAAPPLSSKCGYIFTLSGECRENGRSCWPW